MLKKNGIYGVFVNRKKDPDGKYYEMIVSLFEKHGMNFRRIEDASEDLSDIRLMFVLGGDGTILSVIRKISDISVPLFNVNIGTLGFLSEVEINELENALPKIIEDKGRIESRLMISTACEDGRLTAINEFCVMNENRQKMVHVSVYINGDRAGNFDADGILVSTPTGASAYSLSAGGPIVYPNANCMLITPVCAHSIAARPIVVNADDEILIKSYNGNMILACDWQGRHPVKEGFELKIGKSEKCANFYKIDEHGFFDRMREKLTYNINR